MKKQAIICVGCGNGDETKGSIVDYLVHKYDSKLVVRFSGGSQCAHNVVTPRCGHHIFAQLGSGSFKLDCDTLLLDKVVINPLSLINELDIFTKKIYRDIRGYKNKIHIHEECLVITPYHIAANRIIEKRRDEKHGSCGQGIGVCVEYALKFPENALRIKDLKDFETTKKKLEKIKQYYLDILNCKMGDNFDDVINDCFFADDDLDESTDMYNSIYKWFDIVDDAEAKELINNQETVIFEGAQGVLLDENYGFHPHTTWTTTTSQNAEDFLEKIQYQGEIIVLGLIRAYATRHGAGPFPSKIGPFIHPTEYNKNNKWQDDFNYGYLDITLLRYALTIQKVDKLIVTCLDNNPLDKYVIHRNSRIFHYGLPQNIEDQQRITNHILKYENKKKKYKMDILNFYTQRSDYFGRTNEICHLLDRVSGGFSYGPTRNDKCVVL